MVVDSLTTESSGIERGERAQDYVGYPLLLPPGPRHVAAGYADLSSLGGCSILEESVVVDCVGCVGASIVFTGHSKLLTRDRLALIQPGNVSWG